MRWPFSPRGVLPIILTVIAAVVVAGDVAQRIALSRVDAVEFLEDPVGALAVLSLREIHLDKALADLPDPVHWLVLGSNGTTLESDWDDLQAYIDESWPELSEYCRQSRADVLDTRDKPFIDMPFVIRAVGLTVLELTIIAAALVFLTSWLLRGRPSIRLAERLPLPAAGIGRGLELSTWTLAVFAVMLTLGGFAYLVGNSFGDITFTVLTVTVAAMTLVALHLLVLRPQGLRPGEALGLRWPARHGRVLLLVAVTVLGLDWLFEWSVAEVAAVTGVENPWAESVDETLLFGPPVVVAISMLGTVLAGPFFEELVFRGMIYGALRSRLRVLPAALISGLIFGALHPYGIVGVVIVSFSGFLYALVYERTRSLLPVFVVHACSNLFVSVSMLACRG